MITKLQTLSTVFTENVCSKWTSAALSCSPGSGICEDLAASSDPARNNSLKWKEWPDGSRDRTSILKKLELSAFAYSQGQV